MSAQSQERRVPLTSARLSAVISVALVLVLLGLVGLMGIAGHNIAGDMKSRLGFTIVMSPDANAAAINGVNSKVSRAHYTRSVAYASPQVVLQRWQELTGDDVTAADALDGYNPFSPEIDVAVKPEYGSPDSLRRIASSLELLPEIDRVEINADEAQAVSSTVNRMGLWLGGVALILLLISLALINNTVRLTIYARRFLINTMQLVGATASIIRRPFVLANAANGAVAGLTATLLLAALLYWVEYAEPVVAAAIPWTAVAMLAAALVLLGVVICVAAAIFAVNKYLRTDRDQLYLR